MISLSTFPCTSSVEKRIPKFRLNFEQKNVSNFDQKLKTLEVFKWAYLCLWFKRISNLTSNDPCAISWLLVTALYPLKYIITTIIGSIGHGFKSYRGLKFYSFSHDRVMLKNSPFTFHYRAQNSPSLFHL